MSILAKPKYKDFNINKTVYYTRQQSYTMSFVKYYTTEAFTY